MKTLFSRMGNQSAAGLLVCVSILCSSPTSHAFEWSGNMALQSRDFLHEPDTFNTEQHNHYLSMSLEPELYHQWDNKRQSLTFAPFYRRDQHDEERSHGDIRELAWHRVYDHWELKLGISKVFWGVTESQHLVDVINQTDTVENIDAEDKLGQPMIKASVERDWGVLDIFVLPGFRERTYSGTEGRPRNLATLLDARYESADEDKHIDYALRWFNTLGDWDMGLSWFKGTSREAIMLPALITVFPPQFIPYYPQMEQLGLDLQATTEGWLWKLEVIYRDWMEQKYFAATAGLEYTFYGLFDSDTDLGVICEYLYDEREQNLTTPFENDIMLGMRLAFNDADSSEALFGFIIDQESQETLMNIETSRRIGNNWKIELEARLFQNIKQNGLLQAFEKDDFIQLNLGYYF